jgi:hypothetical protein
MDARELAVVGEAAAALERVLAVADQPWDLHRHRADASQRRVTRT